MKTVGVVRVEVILRRRVCGGMGMYVIFEDLGSLGCRHGGDRSLVCWVECYWLEGIGGGFPLINATE